VGVGVRFANEGAVRRSFAFRARAGAGGARGAPVARSPRPPGPGGRRPARPDRVDLGASDRTVLLAASPRPARPQRETHDVRNSLGARVPRGRSPHASRVRLEVSGLGRSLSQHSARYPVSRFEMTTSRAAHAYNIARRDDTWPL
jgi:hypothetical protein